MGYFPSFWGPQNILSFLSLPGSDLTCSSDKALGNSVNKVPGWFLKGLYLHHEVSLSSLKLSGHIWFYTCPSQIWHSTQRLDNMTNISVMVSYYRQNRFLLKLWNNPNHHDYKNTYWELLNSGVIREKKINLIYFFINRFFKL